jgi:bacterioferritin-associated ferredoxin
MKSRTKRLAFVMAAAAALCLSGCGSSPSERAAPPPKLPAPVAQTLAARSDEVAQALAAGDSCGALDAAHQLQQETIAAINARRVSAAFQEHLLTTVNDLASRIGCVPVQEEPEQKDHHKGKREKGDKGKG